MASVYRKFQWQSYFLTKLLGFCKYFEYVRRCLGFYRLCCCPGFKNGLHIDILMITSYILSLWKKFFLLSLPLIFEVTSCNLLDSLFSDAMAVVLIINKQSSKDKTSMRLVRRLVTAALTHNINKANHIRGDRNCIANHSLNCRKQEPLHRGWIISQQCWLITWCTFSLNNTAVTKWSIISGYEKSLFVNLEYAFGTLQVHLYIIYVSLLSGYYL